MHEDFLLLKQVSDREQARKRAEVRKLWLAFQAGEMRAMAKLPLSPDPKWSKAQKAAHKWGWRYANGLDTSKCGGDK